jgi:hypothetical protein
MKEGIERMENLVAFGDNISAAIKENLVYQTFAASVVPEGYEVTDEGHVTVRYPGGSWIRYSKDGGSLSMESPFFPDGVYAGDVVEIPVADALVLVDMLREFPSKAILSQIVEGKTESTEFITTSVESDLRDYNGVSRTTLISMDCPEISYPVDGINTAEIGNNKIIFYFKQEEAGSAQIGRSFEIHYEEFSEDYL